MAAGIVRRGFPFISPETPTSALPWSWCARFLLEDVDTPRQSTPARLQHIPVLRIRDMKTPLTIMGTPSAVWCNKITLGCVISLALIWSVFLLRKHDTLSLDSLKHTAGDVDEYVKGTLGKLRPWHLQEDEEEEEEDDDDDEEEISHMYHEVGDDFFHQAIGNQPAHHTKPHINPSGSTKTPTKGKPKKTKTWDEASFRKAWLATEIGGPEDWTRLEELCNQTTWRTDVVLDMYGSRGGIGNVRGTILDLFHFTIRVGASHLILPSYVRRADATLDWMDESQGYWPFSNLFDETYFTTVMATHCPQMTLHASAASAPHTAKVEPFYEVPRARTDIDSGETVERVIGHFGDWIAAKPPGYMPGQLNLVTVLPTLWWWDMLPSPRVRKTLGRLLKINPDIRNLAAKAMYNLRTGGYGLEEVIDPRVQIHGADGFYGMHLRTERDAAIVNWANEFGGYDSQAAIHLAKCQSLGLKVIYLATGDRADVDRFKLKAMSEANITVVTKNDLLSAPEDTSALQEMSWDQNGALDWEILSRSSFFSGPVMVS